MLIITLLTINKLIQSKGKEYSWKNKRGHYFFFNIYLFGCAGSLSWHVGSSSLTRDQTQAPCTGSTEVLATGPPEKPKRVCY